MKALSLTQPWASAIALGIKQWETRSWSTKFRGGVCIHATKGFPKRSREFTDLESIDHPELDELPLGFIVALATMTKCQPTDAIIETLSKQERKWGDYSSGRFAFKMENIRVLETPVSARGSLGFWNVKPELLESINAQLI